MHVQTGTPPAEHYADLEVDGRQATLRLNGAWTVAHLPEEERASKVKIPEGIDTLVVDGSGLEEVDTSGAWLIVNYVRSARLDTHHVEWRGFSTTAAKVIALIQQIKHLPTPDQPHGAVYRAFMTLGRKFATLRQEGAALLSFFGQLCAVTGNTLTHPERLRVKSVFYHINEICLRATPIIALMAFLISIVMGYQGASQLKTFGATIFTVDLVSVSMLREMGVLVTAILVAGRSSSAFAAQIGVMRMNDEVAALRTIGLDPFEMLILPRMIAIVIALPILTFLADLVGLVGAFLTSSALLHMAPLQFMERLHDAVNSHTFYIGLAKAPVFGVLIGLVGCEQGMQVRSSATELGMRTTRAVVQSIFLVILADALFSVFFTMMDI
jgi:phospholipid/cholesterol/gamma-HCH transport system permease protein